MNEQWSRVLSSVVSFIFKYWWFIFAGGLAITFLQRRFSYMKMQTVAQKLGLEFQTFKPTNHDLDRIQLLSSGEQNKQIPPKVIQFITSGIDFVLPFFSQWKMIGRWNTIPVSIYKEVRKGNNNRNYTVVRAETGSEGNLGLLIVAESFGRTIGKAFHTVQDIQTGNDRLDKKIILKAKDVDRAKMLLNNTYLQDAILQALEFSSAIRIDDQSVTFTHAGTLTDEQKLRSALDQVTQTAHALKSAMR